MEVWIGRDGERHGPYQETDVREWLRSGQVSRQDLGWYDGLADWQPLSVLFPDVVVADAAPQPPTFNPIAPPRQTAFVALEDYASFWKRVGAYILDGIVLYLPNRIIMTMMGSHAAEETLKRAQLAAQSNPQAMLAAMTQFYSTMAPAFLITSLLAWAYFAVCESSPWQGTLGKLALGIRVTDMQGARISFTCALGRYPAKFLSSIILGIGFLMVAWTSRRQGLHDMLANTLVLNGRASEFKSGNKPTAGPNGSLDA